MKVFLDFEASSLSDRSHPIEVAWVFQDGRGESHLIAPAPAWADWDDRSEAIHGISRDELARDGEPHDEVSRRMVEALTDHDLFASAPSWDGKWLSALLRSAGVPRRALRLRDTDDALRETVAEILASAFEGPRLEREVHTWRRARARRPARLRPIGRWRTRPGSTGSGCGRATRPGRCSSSGADRPVPTSFLIGYGLPMADAAVRKIIHVDMDAFYASVEQRDDPSLRGRPVAVGHAAARGVVAAASYEARTFGVRSALPSVTALRRCPDLVFVPPRFDVYRDVSRRIHEVFARYTDLIQPLSLDEAYLDVTANRRGIATAWLTAKEIRAAILEETGLTASAGISYNKFLAKLASDHRKPNGQFAITPEMGAAWVETLPVSRFHGVGPVTADKMKRLGIATGADLRARSMEFLERHFGSSAGWYHAIARGRDDRPVNPDRVRKSSGSETTFDRDLVEPSEIEAGVLRMADDVWRWCETHAAFGRTVTVKVKYGDFRQITRRRSQPAAVDTREGLHAAALELIRSVLPPERGVRLVGVTVSSFAEPAAAPVVALPMFAGDVAA